MKCIFTVGFESFYHWIWVATGSVKFWWFSVLAGYVSVIRSGLS